MIKVYNNFAIYIKNSNYGIGFKKLKLIYKRLGFNLNSRIRYRILKLLHFIYLYKNEKRFVFGLHLQLANEKIRTNLRIVNCLRSVRYDYGLPCNGQRTQTNGRTSKDRRYGRGASGKSVSFKDDMSAYNTRRKFRHSKKKKKY